jgi:hypothetical protein
MGRGSGRAVDDSGLRRVPDDVAHGVHEVLHQEVHRLRRDRWKLRHALLGLVQVVSRLDQPVPRGGAYEQAVRTLMDVQEEEILSAGD